MFEEDLFEAETVTDDHILRAEYCAREETAVRAAEDLDQVSLPLEVAHQLLNQLNIFHKAPFMTRRVHDI